MVHVLMLTLKISPGGNWLGSGEGVRRQQLSLSCEEGPGQGAGRTWELSQRYKSTSELAPALLGSSPLIQEACPARYNTHHSQLWELPRMLDFHAHGNQVSNVFMPPNVSEETWW